MSRAAAPPAVRWTAYIAVAVVFAIACAFLSNWQFTRNASRSEQLALIEANYDAPPVPLADVLDPGADLATADQWRPVMLEGEYLADAQVLVRNRPHGGTAAFEVVVPFRLDDGRTLAVNRGWVPPGDDQADPDEIPAPPSGHTEVIVRLRPGEALPASGRSAPEGQVPTLHLPAVAEASGVDVETGAYGIMVSEDPAPASRPAALESPSDDPGPHLSYAIQWILFAIMGFVFIGYIIRTERRHRREDDEDDDADSTPTSRRPRPRRDRDADEEDALLDRAGR